MSRTITATDLPVNHRYRGIQALALDEEPFALMDGHEFVQTPVGWGCQCPESAALACAILCRETSPDEAIRRHLRFMEDIISTLAGDWEFTSVNVQNWLELDRANYPAVESGVDA